MTDPKKDLVLLRFVFHALGLGHYMFTEQMTTRDWKQWRLRAELPVVASGGHQYFEPIRNHEGVIMAEVFYEECL